MLPLQQRLLKYLAEFVGEPSPLIAENSKQLPLFLRERFQLRATALWGRRVLFAVEDESWAPGAPGDYENLAVSLRSQVGEPVMLVISRLPAYARNRLVRMGIPFVVPGTQFFLPLILMDLRERFSPPRPVKGKRLTPAAQSLVLYHLQRGSLEHQPLKDLATAIGYSPIMLTKVKDELAGGGVVRVRAPWAIDHSGFSTEGTEPVGAGAALSDVTREKNTLATLEPPGTARVDCRPDGVEPAHLDCRRPAAYLRPRQ